MDGNYGNGAQPVVQQPPMPVAQPVAAFTGGQKAGWLFVGMLLGIPGIIIASLANVNHPDRSTATKMAAIGVGIWVALFILMFFFASCSMATIAATASSSYYGY